MKSKEFKSVEEALEIFEKSAVLYSNALTKGNSRTANKNFDICINCVLYLHEHGQIKKLHPLLKHEDPGVRLKSACILLPFYRQESENVLSEIANGNYYPLTSFNAEMTLVQWKKGNLISPWEWDSQKIC